MSLPTARVLTIAGSDSGGGAGIQADLKTMLAHGVHGMTVLTAVTAQNSVGVQGIWPLPPEAIQAQFRSVVDDIGVDAIKIGMLGSAATVACVAELVADLDPPVPLIVDPVCVSKHGDQLIDHDAIGALRTLLFRYATVITPNLNEAAALTGRSAETPAPVLADLLLADGPAWVLIKGGHRAGDAVDYLKSQDGRTSATGRPATTIGIPMEPAARLPRPWPASSHLAATCRRRWGSRRRMSPAPLRVGLPLGEGIGPTDHLWQLRDHLAISQ